MNSPVYAGPSMAGNLNAIFNLAGTRLSTLVAYLGFCSVSGKSPREFLKPTTELHNVVWDCEDCYNLELHAIAGIVNGLFSAAF
jgi:hypothetical protein